MDGGARLLTNPFGEVWRARSSATSIGAVGAGRAHRSFRLTPSGRFATFGGKCPGGSIIRASLTVALMGSLPRFGSLWAFGPSAHRAHASLRATGLTLPSVPLQSGFVSPGFPRSLNRRGGRWPRPPLVSLPTFGKLCHLRWQQPTGLTLPSGARRAGSLRPRAQTFLKHLAEKAGAAGLFRQAVRPPSIGRRALDYFLPSLAAICTGMSMRTSATRCPTFTCMRASSPASRICSTTPRMALT